MNLAGVVLRIAIADRTAQMIQRAHDGYIEVPSVPALVGASALIIIADLVSRVYAVRQLYMKQSANGTTGWTPLFNFLSTFYSLFIIIDQAPEVITVEWSAFIVQYMFAIFPNALVFFAIYHYSDKSTRTRLSVGGWFAAISVIAGLLLSMSAPTISALFAERVAYMKYVPSLNDLFFAAAIFYDVIAWIPQGFVTVFSERPETTHWVYVGITLIGCGFVGLTQFLEGASWIVWFSALLPCIVIAFVMIALVTRLWMRRNIPANTYDQLGLTCTEEGQANSDTVILEDDSDPEMDGMQMVPLTPRKTGPEVQNEIVEH